MAEGWWPGFRVADVAFGRRVRASSFVLGQTIAVPDHCAVRCHASRLRTGDTVTIGP